MFKPSQDGKPYFIPMPPPNITGRLHLGHSLFATLQDILIRYHRMRGFSALWLPGTDHAGLATQEKLDREMTDQGLDPNGSDFPEFARQYKDRLGGEINHQMRRMGASCDWSRYRFTLDDGYSRAVEHAFHICQDRDMLFEKDNDLFLDMSDLASRLLAEIDAGNLRIIPAYGEQTLRHFLENIEPWCISRQIRWGHRIPGRDDIFDTWFSSALWPFATLGWPEQTPDLKKFFPAALIETADDILFFWCARMLMMGLLIMDEMPFRTIFLHGLIRDEQGRKMSKSLDNGIDPLEIIDEMGCDALRFMLTESATPGQDTRMQRDKLQAGKAMRIKLWNTARFALPLMREGEITHPDDLNFLSRLTLRKDTIGQHIEDMEFHLCAAEARAMLFDDLSSHYIQTAKDRLYAGDTSAQAALYRGFGEVIKCIHPIMPFVTQEIADHAGIDLTKW